jgi:acylphosphatase
MNRGDTAHLRSAGSWVIHKRDHACLTSRHVRRKIARIMMRYTVHFAGRVQGVGFRFTTVRLAADHAVAGYVQNQPDGRVRLIAEGQAADLDALLADLRRRMAHYIRDCHIDQSPATGEFGPPEPGNLDIRY